MLKLIVNKLFGTRNERELKKFIPLVEKIGSFEPEIQKLSDEGLRAKTQEFRDRLANGETLDDLLPEAFAVVSDRPKVGETQMQKERKLKLKPPATV